MEASHILNNLVEGFIENLEVLRGSGVINAEAISDYSEMVERNLHSWLQYTVIDAAGRLGLICVPDVKLYFSKPLNPLEFGKVGKKTQFH